MQGSPLVSLSQFATICDIELHITRERIEEFIAERRSDSPQFHFKGQLEVDYGAAILYDLETYSVSAYVYERL
jgi:hypothetical protein